MTERVRVRRRDARRCRSVSRMRSQEQKARGCVRAVHAAAGRRARPQRSSAQQRTASRPTGEDAPSRVARSMFATRRSRARAAQSDRAIAGEQQPLVDYYAKLPHAPPEI